MPEEKYRINVSLHGKNPGDIVAEGDPHFEVFRTHAKNKDRKGGALVANAVADAEEFPVSEGEYNKEPETKKSKKQE